MSNLIPINTDAMNPIELFKPERITEILDLITKEAQNYIKDIELMDMSKIDDREAVKSFAFQKIIKSKTAIDGVGKELVADWKQKSSIIDAERKRVRDTLDALADQVRAPALKFEEQDKKRKEDHQDALVILAHFKNYTNHDKNLSVEALNEKFAESSSFFLHRDWQEFTVQAAEQYRRNTEAFENAILIRKQYEADQAELAALRAAKEEQERKQAEENAKIEQEAREKRLADEAVEKALAEERRKTKEAEDRALKAEQDALNAKAAEEAKLKAKQEAEEQERLKRERTTQHRGKIHAGIKSALIEKAGLNESAANNVIDALKSGSIPFVQIHY